MRFILGVWVMLAPTATHLGMDPVIVAERRSRVHVVSMAGRLHGNFHYAGPRGTVYNVGEPCAVGANDHPRALEELNGAGLVVLVAWKGRGGKPGRQC